jgi:DNA ligase (NAD+)
LRRFAGTALGNLPEQEDMNVLTGVEFQVGRKGALTQAARLEPAFVGDVTVSRSTLQSMDELERKDARIADTVIFGDAGDVISEVIEFVLERRPSDARVVRVPKPCPVCDSDTERVEGEAVARCFGGSVCRPQHEEAIRHSTSRRWMNVEALGTKLIDQLVEQDFAETRADVYDLTQERLLPLNGMGEKVDREATRRPRAKF